MNEIDPISQILASDNAKEVALATDDELYWFFLGSGYFLQMMAMWLARMSSGDLTAAEAEGFLAEKILHITRKDREAIAHDYLEYPLYEKTFKELKLETFVNQWIETINKQKDEPIKG